MLLSLLNNASGSIEKTFCGLAITDCGDNVLTASFCQ